MPGCVLQAYLQICSSISCRIGEGALLHARFMEIDVRNAEARGIGRLSCTSCRLLLEVGSLSSTVTVKARPGNERMMALFVRALGETGTLRAAAFSVSLA